MVVDLEKAQCQQQPVVTKCKKPADSRRCYAVRVCIEKNPTKIKCTPCPAPPPISTLTPLCNRPPVVCCNCKSPPAPPTCARPPPSPCARPEPPPCARPAPPHCARPAPPPCARPQPPPPSCPKKINKCQVRDIESQTCNVCPRKEQNTQCCLMPPPPPKCRTQDTPCQTCCKETRHCGHQISPGCCQKHTKHCQTELDSGCCAEGVAHDRQACNKPCCRKPAAAANNNCGETRDACNITTAKKANCATGCGKGDGGETWNKKRANKKKCGNANNNRRPPPPPPAPIPQTAPCDGERKFEFPFLGRTPSGNLKVRPSMVSYENREFGILVANPDCMRTSVKRITSCDMILSDPGSPPQSPPCRRAPPPPKSRPRLAPPPKKSRPRLPPPSKSRPRQRPPPPCGPCEDAEESPPASTCRTAHQKLPARQLPAPTLLRTHESHHIQYHHEITEEYSDIDIISPLEDEPVPKGRCTACSSRAKTRVPQNKMGRNESYVDMDSSIFGDEPEPMGRCTACSSRPNTQVSRNKMGHAESWNYVNPSLQKVKQCKKRVKKQPSMHPSPSAQPPPVTTVSRGYQPSYFLEPGGALSKHTTITQKSGQETVMENEMDLWDEDVQTSFTLANRSAHELVMKSQRTLPSAPAFPHPSQQTGLMSDADGYHTPTELHFVAGTKTAPEHYLKSLPMTTIRPSTSSRRTQRSSPTLKSSAMNVEESESEMVGKLHYVLKGTVDPDAKVTVGDAVFPVHSVVLEIRKRPESDQHVERKGQTPSTKEISNVKLPDFNSLPISYNEGASEMMEDTAAEETQDETSHMGENDGDYVDHISMKPVDRVCNLGGGGAEHGTSKVRHEGWEDDYSMSDRIHTSAVGSSMTFMPSEYKPGKSYHEAMNAAPGTVHSSAVGSSIGFFPEDYEPSPKPTREHYDLHHDDESIVVSEDERPFTKSYHSGPAPTQYHSGTPSHHQSGSMQSQYQSGPSPSQYHSGQTQSQNFNEETNSQNINGRALSQNLSQAQSQHLNDQTQSENLSAQAQSQNQSGQQRSSFHSASNMQSQQHLRNDEDTDTDTTVELAANKSFKSSSTLPAAVSAHSANSDLSRDRKELNPFSEEPMQSETQMEMAGRAMENTDSSGTVLLAPHSTEDTLMRMENPSGSQMYPQHSTMDAELSTDQEDTNEVPYDPDNPPQAKPRKLSHEEEDKNAPKDSLLPNLDVIHGAIIAFGGINPRKPWAEWNNGRDVFMYTKDTDKWTKVGHLPAPRSHYGIARVENDVYIIGGTDPSHKDSHHKNVAVRTNFKVNLRSGEWDTLLTELPQARSHFGCAAFNKSIYVIGGNIDSRASSSCLKYDTESQEWSEIAPLDTTRSHMGIEVYKNGILVAGGTCRDAKKPVLDTVMFYDPALNSWTAWKSLPSPRAFSTLAVLKGKLYLVAGAGLRDVHKRRNTSLPDILYFDQAQNRWEEAGTLRHPRHGHASAVVDDSIVVIAGVSSHFQGPINAVDIWSPASPHSRKAHHFRHSQSGMSAITL